MTEPLPDPPELTPEPRPNRSADALIKRHLRLGWWGLLVFLTMGAALEALHAFKVGFYLDVSNDARRLVWRLAHAHGTLLSVINIIFALTSNWLEERGQRPAPLTSSMLMAATILLPLGFFLGGLFIHGGDPGLGVLLVPPGAVLLFIAVLLTARGVR